MTNSQQLILNDVNVVNARGEYWLWIYLINTGMEYKLAEEIGEKINEKSARKRLLENAVNSLDHSRQKSIARHYEESVVDPDHIKWIKPEDARLISWLTPRLIAEHHKRATSNDLIQLPAKPHIHLIPQPNPNSNFNLTLNTLSRYSVVINKYEMILLYLDSLAIAKNEKIKILSSLKYQWGQHLKGDKALKWIESSNTDQCDWCYEYIHKNSEGTWTPFTLNTPIDSHEKYISVLSFFDMCTMHPDTKTQYINKMKKSWNQKTYRLRNTGKKQCNFMLSTRLRKKLDQAAKSKNISASALLEELIEDM